MGVSKIDRRRFPVDKQVYLQSVGRLLPHRICQIMKELGFNESAGYMVWINPKQGNGVDLKVWCKDSLIIVGEILNWSIGSKLSDKRFRSIVGNLSKYECVKVLIYTVLDEEKVEKFKRYGIHTLEIGFQLLPKSFYNFFKDKGEVKKRKIDSKHSKETIKRKIEEFIQSINKECYSCSYKYTINSLERTLRELLKKVLKVSHWIFI